MLGGHLEEEAVEGGEVAEAGEAELGEGEGVLNEEFGGVAGEGVGEDVDATGAEFEAGEDAFADLFVEDFAELGGGEEGVVDGELTQRKRGVLLLGEDKLEA